jgi:hypothetical protein
VKNKRFAFVATISPGYMFSLNATMNAMKYYGTEADFHIVHHEAMTQEYMDACSKAFPFKVVWNLIKQREPNRVYNDLYHAFFAEKYWWANHIKDDYDAVCIIDGDLFLCGNMNEWFEKAFNEKKLITADHKHSMFPVESLYKHSIDDIRDRMYAALADFPVFFDPKHHNQFLKDWYDFTFDYAVTDERSHPLIAMNRSIRKNIKQEDIIVLDGHQWVCDFNYWETRYVERDMMMFNPERVYAIHNRWWKEGRANNEIAPNRNDSPNFFNAISNFNSIRDFMAKFNAMTPETMWKDYERMEFK